MLILCLFVINLTIARFERKNVGRAADKDRSMTMSKEMENVEKYDEDRN